MRTCRARVIISLGLRLSAVPHSLRKHAPPLQWHCLDIARLSCARVPSLSIIGEDEIRDCARVPSYPGSNQAIGSHASASRPDHCDRLITVTRRRGRMSTAA